MAEKATGAYEVEFYEEKGWGVRRKNSDKVIKYFKTKLEASEYAVSLGDARGEKVVFRKKNGAFQKSDNALRAVKQKKSLDEKTEKE